MAVYEVYPDCADWRVSSESSDKIYTYQKRSAAKSMAKSIKSDNDSIVYYRFDGELLDQSE